MNSVAGTRQLIRLALRRDRVLLPVCAALFALTATGTASATIKVYPTDDSVAQAARSMNATPALVALYGRVYDEHSLVVRLRFDLVQGGSAASDLGDDVLGGGFPDEWFGVGVPVFGPGGDGLAEVGDAGKHAAA